MTRYGMLINTKKCVGCSACRIACQMKNHLDPEESFIKYHEIETGEYPNVYNEIVPTQCMHCEDAPCAAVCPTHATYITDSGVVLVDEEKCIGCKYCMMACPYGVRDWNKASKTVEKCTLCEQKVAQGELPQCVAQCGARARFFGDLDEGLESFKGAGKIDHSADASYEAVLSEFCTLGEIAKPVSEEDVHHLPDVGNGPSFSYILRNRDWKGDE